MNKFIKKILKNWKWSAICLILFCFINSSLLSETSYRRLTFHPMEDVFPVWSPDGKKIIFNRGTGIAFDSYKYSELHKFKSYIFIIDTDGTNLMRLSDLKGHDLQYSFSPDGKKIVFSRFHEGKIRTKIDIFDFWGGEEIFVNKRHSNIYIMDADGKNLKNLTNNKSENSYAEEPCFSPDGSKIVFSAWDKGLWTINLDGSNLKQIVKRYARYPKWSPDGNRITFESDDGLYVVNTNGTNLTKIVDEKGSPRKPIWSPDGKKILFSALYKNNGKTNYEIFMIDMNDLNIKKITNMGMFTSNPVWSSDGEKIAFESGGKIYIMNRDGSEVKRITNWKGREKYPSFSPGDKEIAFASIESGNWEIYVIEFMEIEVSISESSH